MSILGRLVALLLISFLAMAPGLAGASAPGQPTCDMVGMQHDASGGMTAKALAAICKMQCHAPAMLPQPEPAAQGVSLPLSFPQLPPPGLPSRPNPPEAPPPRS